MDERERDEPGLGPAGAPQAPDEDAEGAEALTTGPALGPQVLEGEDDLPRQPISRRDPYIPEPGARPGEQRAFRVMRWAWLPVLAAVAIVVWAALR